MTFQTLATKTSTDTLTATDIAQLHQNLRQELFVPFARSYVTTPVSSVSFQNIPTTYEHLMALMIHKSTVSTGASTSAFQVNGDVVATNYVGQYIWALGPGNGSMVAGENLAFAGGIMNPYTGQDMGSWWGFNMLFVPNYKSTNLKTFYALGCNNEGNLNTVGQNVTQICSHTTWKGTVAVNRIDFFASGFSIDTKSYYILYGLGST